jgi:hypothetical protein
VKERRVVGALERENKKIEVVPDKSLLMELPSLSEQLFLLSSPPNISSFQFQFKERNKIKLNLGSLCEVYAGDHVVSVLIFH